MVIGFIHDARSTIRYSDAMAPEDQKVPQKSFISVGIFRTCRFSVLSHPDESFNLSRASASSTHPKLKIFLDVDCPYTCRAILEAFAHPSRKDRFEITLGPGRGLEAIALPKGCDFQWAEYERIDWSAVLDGKHGASSYCIRKGLSRKAQLAYYTQRYTCKHPESTLSRSLPQTIVIDTWPAFDEGSGNINGNNALADILSASGSENSWNVKERLMKCLSHVKSFMANTSALPDPMWILKGSTTNKGSGIHLVHFFEEVIDICWSECDIREWVLQRYIASPLLLRKRKFHIRAYALAVSSLRVYLSLDCLALCSGTRYRANDFNKFAHITNTAYQDLDPGFRESECVLAWEGETIAAILLKDGTCKTETEAKNRVAQVFADMLDITSELFNAYASEFGVFSPIPGCFEHFGLDFLVDSHWRVYLLEVNPGPDFKQTGSRLSHVVLNLMSSTIDIVFPDASCETPNRRSEVGNMVLAYDNPKYRNNSKRAG